MTYNITLADGTQISNLRLNGNNFISDAPVNTDIFANNCSPVTINDELHEHMELVQVTQMGDEYWFILRDITLEELEKIQARADVEYIAMMAGVEL